jgi:formylglycine-generating enzyme required for sulfatase activity
MRHYPIISILLLLLGCSTSNPLNDSVRKQPKLLVQAPGVLWLKDNIYIDETEVTNFQYTEYVFWVQRHKPSSYNIVLPDTSVWLDYFPQQTELYFVYLKHPGFRDYPVVGISYDQAVLYCKWRTDMVNCMLYNKKIGVKKWSFDSTFNYPKLVKYRLPTKEEWSYAAQAGLDNTKYPLGLINLSDDKGKPISNTQELFNIEVYPHTNLSKTEKISYYKLCPTRFVKAATPNKYGLHDMTGNVSEIVNDNFVMGLNFKTNITGQPLYEESYSLAMTKDFKKPENWIGFRCVCEVLRNE